MGKNANTLSVGQACRRLWLKLGILRAVDKPLFLNFRYFESAYLQGVQKGHFAKMVLCQQPLLMAKSNAGGMNAAKILTMDEIETLSKTRM